MTAFRSCLLNKFFSLLSGNTFRFLAHNPVAPNSVNHNIDRVWTITVGEEGSIFWFTIVIILTVPGNRKAFSWQIVGHRCGILVCNCDQFLELGKKSP